MLMTNIPISTRTAIDLIKTITIEKATIDMMIADGKYKSPTGNVALSSNTASLGETTLKNGVKNRLSQISQLKELVEVIESSYDELNAMIDEEIAEMIESDELI